MKYFIVASILGLSLTARAAEEPTFIIPEDVFKTFSEAKRIEYIKSVLKILMNHEKTWNAEVKFSLIDLLLTPAHAQAPYAREICIIGTRSLKRDPATKMCTTQIPSTCEGAPRSTFQCGEFNLNKCVPRLPISNLSQRCFEATIADVEGLRELAKDTTKIENAVKMYQAACNSSGDYNGCFFLAQQLKALGKEVGNRTCDSMNDDALLAAGNVLIGNGRKNASGVQTETVAVPYKSANGQATTINLGSLQCAKCHGNTLYEFTENENWKKENNEDDRPPLATDTLVLAHIRTHTSLAQIEKDITSQPGKSKDAEGAITGISCILGRFIDIGLRYQTVISADRNNWKMPNSAKPRLPAALNSPSQATTSQASPARPAPTRPTYPIRRHRRHSPGLR